MFTILLTTTWGHRTNFPSGPPQGSPFEDRKLDAYPNNTEIESVTKKAYLRCPFFHFSLSSKLMKNCLSAIKTEECRHVFSLLVNGSRLMHKVLESADPGLRFGLKKGFSFSGTEDTGKDWWGPHSASSLRLERSSQGGIKGCVICPSKSWLVVLSGERLRTVRSSTALSIAAVSSFRHLLSFSDILPEREKVLYYLGPWLHM